ncbi:MAG: hypothetical protein AMXMBFR33_65060 [Candidatus Xenobia bacterium]
MNASVAELKSRLSAYLAHVKEGEEILVTDRGRPVARIIPYVARAWEHSGVLQRLARQGVVRLAARPPDQAFRWPVPVARSRRSVVEALLEERSEGR